MEILETNNLLIIDTTELENLETNVTEFLELSNAIKSDLKYQSSEEFKSILYVFYIVLTK